MDNKRGFHQSRPPRLGQGQPSSNVEQDPTVKHEC